MTPEPAHALIGELIDDRYRIRRLIGRGGMGAVYEAEAVRLGRLCAFKVLLPEYTRNETAIQRFRREAQVAARVKHPHVVEIFDTGTTPGGLGYIAMELLRGESLDRTLRREGRIAWPRARHFALQVCRALSAAHAQRVVHRDMKPENCFRLTQEGDPDFLKVLDFGIAKLTDSEGGDALRLTATDSVIGTYAYMAYEQIKGEECDHRVDVWAVGVILYEMITGTLPFRGQNQGQIWSAIFQNTPVPIRHLLPDAQIPAEVDAVVARALEKSRDARFASVDALAQALAAIDDGGAPVMRRGTGPLPVLATPSPQIDAEAQTVAISSAVQPATASRQRVTEPASPHELTELAAADVRAVTREAVRTEIAPATDPSGRTEIAPASEVIQTVIPDSYESAARPLVPLAPSGARFRAAAWGGGAAVVGVLAFVLFRGSGPAPEPAPADPEPAPAIAPVPVAPPANPATTGAQTPGPPGEELVVLPDEPPPVTPPVPTSPAPADSGGKKKPTRVPKTAAPEHDYAAQVASKLASLCDSKEIRDLFAQAQKADKQMSVKFTIDARTGKARPEFPAMQQGSALVKNLERVIAGWRLPIGGAGEVHVSRSCTLNRPR